MPLFCPVSLVILIHIDDAVPLAHFHRAAGYDIDKSPHGIPDQVHPVDHGLFHLFDMGFQVINAVRIVHRTVRLQSIFRAQAIFRDKYRKLIAVIDLVQRDAQALRVLLPSPFAGFQIRILIRHDQVPAGLFPPLARGRNLGEIVRKGRKVYGIFFQNLIVARFLLNVNLLFPEIALHIGRIGSPCHHIQIEPVGILVIQNHLHHIVGMAGSGVGGKPGDHTSDHRTRKHLMPKLHRQRIGNKLVMQALENGVGIIRFLVLNQTHAVVGG